MVFWLKLILGSNLRKLAWIRLCLHHTGKHFLPTWTAVLYIMNGNNPQLEQVVYTPRTSCRNDWPRRSGKLNPNSHNWIFSSISVGSSRHSYSFTSATVRILVHTPTKSGSTPSGTWRFTFEIGTEQLRSVTKIAPRTEALSCMVFMSAQEL